METMRDSRYGFEVEAEQRGIEQGEKRMLYRLVRKGQMTLESAAKELGLSTQSFELGMKEYDEAQSSAIGAS